MLSVSFVLRKTPPTRATDETRLGQAAGFVPPDLAACLTERVWFSRRFFVDFRVSVLFGLTLAAALGARAQPKPSPDFSSGPVATSETRSALRVGAARALRIVDSENKPLAGGLSEPKWDLAGGLFFTRDWGGTRNVWRAAPDARDGSRYPRWRAWPVTQFAAPLYAKNACPLEDGRTLLLLSNAANPKRGPQVTLFNRDDASWRALTAEPEGVSSVAAAPGGQAFAFASFKRIPAASGSATGEGAGFSAVIRYQNMGRRPAWPQPREIAVNSRNPVWESSALLVEGVPNHFIFRLPIGLDTASPREMAPTRIALGTQVSASRDGSVLVMVGAGGAQDSLFVLSGDGSGMRALPATEGAQAPALTADGRLLAFTAPGAGETATGRAIWIMPLQPGEATSTPVFSPAPVPVSAPGSAPSRAGAPIAQIRAVQRAARGGLAIWGNASGEGASATLEIERDGSSRRRETLSVPLPLAPRAPLAVWNPPASARGLWNFRLSVTGAGGAAQSLFSVRLPLSNTPRDASPLLAKNAKRAENTDPLSSLPTGGPLPLAPLPDLPAAPLPSPAPLPQLLPPAPPRSQQPPRQPERLAPAPIFTPPRQTPSSRPNTVSRGAAQPSPVPLLPSNPASPARDAATFNVSDTLAEMKAKQRTSVTFWGLNRGARAWDVAAGREGTVRLVTRWVRFDNGHRNGWAYQNMKTPVQPGARSRWNFEVIAPTQPGRYKLIYSLQRVPSSAWTPPAYDAPQENWPEDFAAIAFAVTVQKGDQLPRPEVLNPR